MIAEVRRSINEDKKGQTTRALKNFPAFSKAHRKGKLSRILKIKRRDENFLDTICQQTEHETIFLNNIFLAHLAKLVRRQFVEKDRIKLPSEITKRKAMVIQFLLASAHLLFARVYAKY